jgi:hypothetical protein
MPLHERLLLLPPLYLREILSSGSEPEQPFHTRAALPQGGSVGSEPLGQCINPTQESTCYMQGIGLGCAYLVDRWQDRHLTKRKHKPREVTLDSRPLATCHCYPEDPCQDSTPTSMLFP